MASDSLLKNIGGGSDTQVLGANMHKTAASSPFISMLGKDHGAHQQVMNGYLTHWEKEMEKEKGEATDEARKNRENQYPSLVNG